jgi:Tol biopolymer transport system component
LRHGANIAQASSVRTGTAARRFNLFGGSGSGAPSARGRLFGGFLALGLLAALALSAGAALAGQTRVPQAFSPITGAGSGLTIATPGGIAIDESTGNVFLNDGVTTTDILGGEGEAPAGLVSPFNITGLNFASGTNGIAYDNVATSPNKGTLYVVSGSAPLKVQKFTRNPATSKYEPAGELTDPATGATNNAGAAVDTHGNLYVGDFGSKSVVKFNTAGIVVATYNLAGSIERPTSLAVDAAGDLFVQRAGGVATKPGVVEYPANALGEIEPANFVNIIPGGSGATAIAVDPNTNSLFVALGTKIVEYDATTLGKKIEFSSGVLGTTTQLAVNAATNRVYVSDNGAGRKNVAVFGPLVPIPTPTATTATNITATKATLNGTVNPEGLAVTECFFEYGPTTTYGHTVPCEGTLPVDSQKHPVTANIAELTSNGATVHFRLVAKDANGTERSVDKTFVTANTVVTEAATSVTPSQATLAGSLRPEGKQFTQCKLEYGLVTAPTLDHEMACAPAATAIEPDFAVHPIAAALTGLNADATYRFRLVATNSEGTIDGKELTFTTLGSPQITEIRALNAAQASATLEAKVNPRGFLTRYRVEWGPTAAYGNSIPANGFEPLLGSGEQPVLVTAELSGLSPGTIYHYRIVASSGEGRETLSPDQEVETLDSCGLPDQRCFELVSRAETGLVGTPAQPRGDLEIRYQAAATGAGSLAYVVESGFGDATNSPEPLYLASRDSAGWASAQLSPPIVAPSEVKSERNVASSVDGLSSDLACGVVTSFQPLTEDVTAHAVIEAGGGNLYRRNDDGSSYTLITNLPPTNPAAATGAPGTEYHLIGMSRDCGRILFTTALEYPGITGAGGTHFYEWEDGVLRSISGQAAGFSVLSPNGYLFYTATSTAGGDSGKAAVFVRRSPTETVDASQSQGGAKQNMGASYQTASPDGSRVFFTANAGLTPSSSSTGTDLYEYDVESGGLTDLSVSPEVGTAAEAAGVLGVSDDGSHVYFAAQGQLLPGKGSTLAQNQSANTYSVYADSGRDIEFVGVINGSDLSEATIANQQGWTSRISPDGRYLLFSSTADVTGYDSGGASEAYVYDADSDATVCISCRSDGRPSLAPAGFLPLTSAKTPGNDPLYAPVTLADDAGQARVFFYSHDKLTAGAGEGERNLYEWEHGQVFLLATEPAGLGQVGVAAQNAIPFAGASADGRDVYFATSQALNWEHTDGQRAVYDARVGGGFAEPPSSPSCDPNVEGACQGPSPASLQAPAPGTSTFTGTGNPSPPTPKKKKHKKTNHKKKHKKKKHKNGRARHADKNRRAGK